MAEPLKPRRAGSRVRAAAITRMTAAIASEGEAVDPGQAEQEHAEQRDHNGATRRTARLGPTVYSDATTAASGVHARRGGPGGSG